MNTIQPMPLSAKLRELVCILLDYLKAGDLRGHLDAWKATIADDATPFTVWRPRK